MVLRRYATRAAKHVWSAHVLRKGLHPVTNGRPIVGAGHALGPEYDSLILTAIAQQSAKVSIEIFYNCCVFDGLFEEFQYALISAFFYQCLIL